MPNPTFILDDNSKPYVLKRIDGHAFRLVATVSGCSVAGLDGGGSFSDLDEALFVNHGTHDITLLHNETATADWLKFDIDGETGLLTTTALDDVQIPALQRLLMRSGADLVLEPGALFWAPFSEADPNDAPDAPEGFVVDNQGQ